jgi:hypothetical protein
MNNFEAGDFVFWVINRGGYYGIVVDINNIQVDIQFLDIPDILEGNSRKGRYFFLLRELSQHHGPKLKILAKAKQ